MNEDRLQETAMRVKDLTPARVAELTGIKQRRLARFVNEPGSITFVELERVRLAIQRVAFDELRALEDELDERT